MAENNVRFCVKLRWPAEALEDLALACKKPAIEDDKSDIEFRVEGGEGYLFSSRFGHPAYAASLIHEAMDKHGIQGMVTLEWAETCNRMIPGEFGGGLALISKDNYALVSSSEMMEKAIQKMALENDKSPYLEAYEYFAKYPEGGSNKALGKLLMSMYNEESVSLGACLHPLDKTRLSLAKRLVDHYFEVGENDELREIGPKVAEIMYPHMRM